MGVNAQDLAGFGLSDLGSVDCLAVLTNSVFPGRDADKRPSANVAGGRVVCSSRTRRKNGETRIARNAGQLRTSGAALPSTNCWQDLAGKGIGSPSETKGISRCGDTGKVIDSTWDAQNSEISSLDSAPWFPSLGASRTSSRRASAMPFGFPTINHLRLQSMLLHAKQPNSVVVGEMSMPSCELPNGRLSQL